MYFISTWRMQINWICLWEIYLVVFVLRVNRICLTWYQTNLVLMILIEQFCTTYYDWLWESAWKNMKFHSIDLTIWQIWGYLQVNENIFSISSFYCPLHHFHPRCVMYNHTYNMNFPKSPVQQMIDTILPSLPLTNTNFCLLSAHAWLNEKCMNIIYYKLFLLSVLLLENWCKKSFFCKSIFEYGNYGIEEFICCEMEPFRRLSRFFTIKFSIRYLTFMKI